MNKSLYLILGIVGLIAIAGRSAAQAVIDKFRIGSIRMDIRGITSSGINFKLRVPVSNPLPVGLPISSFSGIIRFGSYNLADLFITQPITIESGDTRIYEVDGQVNYQKLGTNLVAIISNNDWRNNLFLDGEVVSSGIPYRFTQPINVI